MDFSYYSRYEAGSVRKKISQRLTTNCDLGDDTVLFFPGFRFIRNYSGTPAVESDNQLAIILELASGTKVRPSKSLLLSRKRRLRKWEIAAHLVTRFIRAIGIGRADIV